MIQVLCRDQKIIYNAYHLVKAFFPEADVSSTVNEEQTPRILVQQQAGTELPPQDPELPVSLVCAEDIRALYQSLRAQTGRELPWGMLTGVRPVKLATGWIAEHPQGEREEFIRWFYEDRFVSREKAGLAFDVAKKEQRVVSSLMPANDSDNDSDGQAAAFAAGRIEGYSLYIGIPFCPSICSYCSFSSGEIGTYRNQVDAYLEALHREMRQKKEGQSDPSTVYIGGGTPTSLSEGQFERLLKQAQEVFRIREGLEAGRIREYTVEAGRPDSITRQKLELMKQYGVTRISVNPQSMQQKTLDAIGRRHTVEQVRQAFFLAREMGFDNINMDLIAGLPGEDREDMLDTLRQVRLLNPDSLTVHSLAVKRSSAIGISRRTEGKTVRSADIAQMIQDAYETACSLSMEPYYLYRQKSIAGNFENIGYARPGKEGLYNILIMEELQSILACGAGASSKLVLKEAADNPSRHGQATYMIRSENVKNIEEYIRRYSGNPET